MIAPTTRMGAVELSVADLGRSVAFYERVLGLRVLERTDGRVTLGAASELLSIVGEPGAGSSRGHTGLYHFALLVPDRVDLARWLAHVARERIPLTGASDHFVSEAIYLSDPDDHGIEVYRDRPRDHWEGRVDRMTTLPLDVADLLSGVDADEPFEALAAGTTMGHVHLRVAAIPETVEFYRDVLGFDLTVVFADQAAFLSAGGYHHHVGANVWESRGATPAPPGTARLRHATIVLPEAAERDRVAARAADAGREPEPHAEGAIVRDPSGNALLLTA